MKMVIYVFGLLLLVLMSVAKAQIGCPAVDPNIVCVRADIQCKGQTDCKPNEKCCPIPCGAKCIAMDVCLQPIISGSKKTGSSRYYYDANDKQCKRFRYSGQGGNENNFRTKKECDKACGKSGPVKPVETKICPKGDPLKDVTCGGPETTGCPRGFYCEGGTTCCEIPCKFGKPHPTRNCPNFVPGPGCPTGYHSLPHPADQYCACCPDGETPGRCPRIPRGKSRKCRKCPGETCINECSSDETCPQNQKCCSDGCVRTCQIAINYTK